MGIKLIIDVPDEFDGNNKHLIHEKFFEYINKQGRMSSEYTILWRTDRKNSYCIKDLIDDWMMDNIEFKPVDDSNMAKVACIKEMVNFADESLIFFNYSSNDLSSKIMMDQCVIAKNVHDNVVRMDFGNTIF